MIYLTCHPDVISCHLLYLHREITNLHFLEQQPTVVINQILINKTSFRIQDTEIYYSRNIKRLRIYNLILLLGITVLFIVNALNV